MEKVLKGLEHCIARYIDGLCDYCPYMGELDKSYMIPMKCKEIIMRDALELLKEQQATNREKKGGLTVATMIQDAPYIVEAELIGYPGGDDLERSVIASQISDADYHIGQALYKLCKAFDLTEGTEYQETADALLERFEDFRCDLNSLKRKIEGREI